MDNFRFKYFLLLILPFLAVNTLFAQKKKKVDLTAVTRKYTVAQMHHELDLIEKKLKKYHPDPYHYISRDSLHSFVSELKSQINAPLTDMEFRFFARQVVAKIGCGHTALLPSKAYMKAVDSFDRKVLPLDVWITDSNRIFVKQYLLRDSLLKKGDEILSIQGVPAKNILGRIYSSFPSDGYNTTYKKQSLQADRFRYFFGSGYGFDSSYAVTVRHISGKEENILLKSLSSKADTLKPKTSKNYTIIYKTTKAIFKIDDKNPHLAVLDINNFGGKKWRKLLRLSFRYLRKHPEIDHLAIDLRDNGGGSVSKGNKLLSYIIDKPFTLRFGRRPNLLPINPFIKLNPGSRITPVSFLLYPVSFVCHKRWTHWFIRFPKQRNNFDGKVYVLTNGRSFSMSVVTATYLKYKANATIIGEETGGTESGSNAMLSGHIILPYTKDQLTIPLYRIDHCVKNEDTRRGLMPDYQLHYSINDLMQGKDLEMEKIRELMRNQGNASR